MDQELVSPMQSTQLQIIDAHAALYLDDVRTLFNAYKEAIDTDLCFQQFEAELANLPGTYIRPAGCLLMAIYNNKPAGCVALRSLEKDIAEMKRLYVDPEYRGLGIGIKLIEEVISRARDIGYRHLRLDTLPSMTKAISLYESLGFIDIEKYTHNPIAGVRYLQLDL